MANHHDSGLCFNCDEDYNPGHRCKSKFQCLLLEDLENLDPLEDFTPTLTPPATTNIQSEPDNLYPTHTLTDETLNPNISLHALEGHTNPTLIQLEIIIHLRPLITLIDGKSTHNFMQGRLARLLNLSIEPSRHFSVMVGNDASLSTEGFCSQVLVTTIFGADFVLGVDWLAQLGLILFDY